MSFIKNIKKFPGVSIIIPLFKKAYSAMISLIPKSLKNNYKNLSKKALFYKRKAIKQTRYCANIINGGLSSSLRSFLYLWFFVRSLNVFGPDSESLGGELLENFSDALDRFCQATLSKINLNINGYFFTGLFPKSSSHWSLAMPTMISVQSEENKENFYMAYYVALIGSFFFSYYMSFSSAVKASFAVSKNDFSSFISRLFEISTADMTHAYLPALLIGYLALEFSIPLVTLSFISFVVIYRSILLFNMNYATFLANQDFENNTLFDSYEVNFTPVHGINSRAVEQKYFLGLMYNKVDRDNLYRTGVDNYSKDQYAPLQKIMGIQLESFGVGFAARAYKLFFMLKTAPLVLLDFIRIGYDSRKEIFSDIEAVGECAYKDFMRKKEMVWVCCEYANALLFRKAGRSEKTDQNRISVADLAANTI